MKAPDAATLRARAAKFDQEPREEFVRWLGVFAELEGLPTTETGRPDVDAWSDEHRQRVSGMMSAVEAAHQCGDWDALDPDRKALARAIAADLGLATYPIDRAFASHADLDLDVVVRGLIARTPWNAHLTPEVIERIVVRANSHGVSSWETWVDAVIRWAEPLAEQSEGDRWGRVLATAYAIRTQVDELIVDLESTINEED